MPVCRRHVNMDDQDVDDDIIIMYWWLRYQNRQRQRQRRRHRYWVHELYEGRQQHGEYYRLVTRELEADDQLFFKYFRMSREQFTYISHMVCPEIEKQNTTFRAAIPARERLAVTIR